MQRPVSGRLWEESGRAERVQVGVAFPSRLLPSLATATRESPDQSSLNA